MTGFKAVFIFSILFLLLVIRFHLFYQNESKYINGQQVVFETTLLTEPDSSGSFQKFSVFLNNRDRVFITTSAFPEYSYGQRLHILGTIRVISQSKSSTQHSKLLTDEKPILTMFFPKIITSKNTSNFALAVTTFVRQNITSLYQKTLPPRSASLLTGIVFGIKQHMDKTFLDHLRFAGVLHVIAASGMNVTMIGGFLSSFLLLFLRRQLALIATIGGILFYCMLAGAEASIVRASIMGILVFSAQIFGRQTLAAYGLFLAGYTMLFVTPSLLFDIGFQLSFAATAGLLYMRPLFVSKDRVKQVVSRSFIGEDILTTICAQIATLPILLANFGSYSLFSVIVNGLVLWTVPILMMFGSLGAILGLIWQPLGQVFVYLCLPWLLYFETIVSFFGNIGVGIELKQFPFQFAPAYYFFLIAYVVFRYQKRQY